MAHATGVTPSTVMAELLARGHEFSFVQVMRIARNHLCLESEQEHPEIPWEERISIRPELTLAFPASDVARVEQDGDLLRVTTTFLGLYGVSSPLPTFFTEDLVAEASDDETVYRDFIDIIHQRLYHLYFQCWSKYRLLVRIVEENNPIDRERLLCLIGLGEKELAHSIPHACGLLRYTGILSQYPRSASGLKTILRDALQLKNIKIIQNVKRKVKIPDDQRMRLGMAGCRLGIDTVLGSHIADSMGKIRIEIGPLTWEDFNNFLPGTERHQQLSRYTRFYLTDPLEVELRLILAAGEARPMRLGDPGSRLGLNTWCFSGGTMGETSATFPVPAFPFKAPSEQTLTNGASANAGRTLADYYQRERAELGELANRFIQKHQNLAPLMSGPMADPGIERLLEGTAFLNALLQRKLDDDIPEFIHEVMNTLDPNSLRPVPASTIIAFSPKPNLTEPQLIPAGTELKSIPVAGTHCRFTTCRPVEIHPLTLDDAYYQHLSGKTPAIKLEFFLHGMRIENWQPESLPLFLNNPFEEASDIFLQLTRNVDKIIINPLEGGSPAILDKTHIRPARRVTSSHESSRRCHDQALSDYFHSPEQFLFIEITGWRKWKKRGTGNRFELYLELKQTPVKKPRITKNSFVLFAVPAENLFNCEARPIKAGAEGGKYKIRPGTGNGGWAEIFSVDAVSGVVSGRQEVIRYEPSGEKKSRGIQAVYHTTISKSPISSGNENSITITNPRNIREPVTLSLELTCSNGDLAKDLRIGDICFPSTNSPEWAAFHNITPVVSEAESNLGNNLLWKKLSGHTVNQVHFQSIESFRTLLKTFIPEEGDGHKKALAIGRRIEGIKGIKVMANDRLIGPKVYRGWEFMLSLNSEYYASLGDLYLFGSVLEIFMGNYATQTVYTMVTLEDPATGISYGWPPRFGNMPLI